MEVVYRIKKKLKSKNRFKISESNSSRENYNVEK